jgi:hypothetical protein
VSDLHAELRRAVGPRQAPVAPSAALRDRIFLDIHQTPSLSRRAAQRRARALFLAACSFSLLVFVFAGGPRIGDRPALLVVGTACGTGVMAVVALWIALGRGSNTLGRSRQWLVSLAIVAPCAFLCWKLLWGAQFDGALAQLPGRAGFKCLALSVVLALLPLGAFAIARRGTDPRAPVLTGLAAGVAFGTAALFPMDLWCPVSNPSHLLLGHLLPLALLGGLGALLGRYFVALRGR